MRALALSSALILSTLVLADGDDHVTVSMVDLIANPSTFIGSTIEVRGYLELAPALNLYLYPTKDHAAMDDFGSALLVSNYVVGDSDIGRTCGGNYAVLKGRFNKSDHWVAPGRWMHQYRFDDVASVSVLEKRKIFRLCYER